MKIKKSIKLISILVPALNEADNISPLVRELKHYLSDYTWEIIFIDDGSTDDTLKLIKILAKKDRRIKYIAFTRNFGHQSALKAGFNLALGDCVISIDADLQHPPSLLPKMISQWKRGFLVVDTKRLDLPRNSNFWKRTTSSWFYALMRVFSNVKLGDGGADFRLLDRLVVDKLNSMNESTFFLRGLVTWLGFSRTEIDYTPNRRFAGKTKYTLIKMLGFAIDAITSFSVFPLRIATMAGLVMSLVSGIYGLYAIYAWMFNGRVIIGWGSVIVSILFMGGLQLVILGIIGEYIGKIFMETKRRPHYILMETNIREKK